MFDVLASDVESPGDRIERGQDRRVGLLGLEPVRHLLPLRRRGLAGIMVGMDDEPGPRRLRPVGPDRVDRIASDGDQLGTLLGERLARLGDPVLGVKPGIVADPAAVRRMRFQPVRNARLGDRLVAPVAAVDLRADLERVAAIGEDGGFLRKHDRRTRRALEAGQPGQALGIAADIFAHMLVGERDDETVEPIGLELFAQRLKARFISGHGNLRGDQGLQPGKARKAEFIFARIALWEAR